LHGRSAASDINYSTTTITVAVICSATITATSGSRFRGLIGLTHGRRSGDYYSNKDYDCNY